MFARFLITHGMGCVVLTFWLLSLFHCALACTLR